MSEKLDVLEEFAWPLGSHLDSMAYLQHYYPNTEFTIHKVADLVLPDNILACDGEGEGEIIPVKRLALTFSMSDRGDSEIIKATFEEIWTSPYAKSYDNRTWDLIFWDTEKDCEVEFKIPIVE